ncbi:hypothetical protein D1136_08865 [Odoribacter sp. Z80]|jgi:hypothetical protein|nr:hypothetical protein [Odoribacter sp. Z80]
MIVKNDCLFCGYKGIGFYDMNKKKSSFFVQYRYFPDGEIETVMITIKVLQIKNWYTIKKGKRDGRE